MKIEEQVLSREQMAHLKSLSIDTSDASMMWVSYDAKDGTGRRYLTINNDMSREIARMMNGVIGSFVPTYTIGDLIEKLPKEIDIYSLDLRYDYYDCACYFAPDWELIEFLHKEKMGDTSPLDALYRLFCWVTKFHKELIK